MKLIFEGKELNLDSSKGKYSIETLQEVAEFIADIHKKLVKRLKDGKMNFFEILQTSFDLGGALQFAGDLEKLKNEIFDLDAAEVKQLVDYLATTFGLSEVDANDLLRNIIFNTIEIVYQAIEIYKNAKEYFGK
jgi:hypothetical protein